MFSPALNDPRPKKLKKGQGRWPPQQFPVPVSFVTDVKTVAVGRWYYRGRLIPGTAGGLLVVVDEDAELLVRLGFFGDKWEKATSPSGSVILRDVDPCPAMAEGDKESPPAGEGLSDDGDPEEDGAGEKEANGKNRRNRKRNDDETSPVVLSPCESYFLSYALGCLVVTAESGEELSLDDLWSTFCRNDRTNRFPYVYRAYHHFRAKGWVVKDGTQFGSDFLLYKHGPPFYHASYCVLAETPSRVNPSSWRDLVGLNRVAESTGKELLIARVTRPATKKTDDADCDGNEAICGPELLLQLRVDEILVRRWVPSQEREDEDLP